MVSSTPLVRNVDKISSGRTVIKFDAWGMEIAKSLFAPTCVGLGSLYGPIHFPMDSSPRRPRWADGPNGDGPITWGRRLQITQTRELYLLITPPPLYGFHPSELAHVTSRPTFRVG